MMSLEISLVRLLVEALGMVLLVALVWLFGDNSSNPTAGSTTTTSSSHHGQQ
jgi:hypothetical protein